MRILKYILFFACLLLLGSIGSIAQLVTGVGSVNTGQYQRGLYGADSAFGLPIRDTTGGYLTTFRYKARITLQPSTGNLYYHNGTRWVGIGGLYANGYGLALLGNVFSVDTTVIATRAFASSGFIKYADSNIIFVTPYAMNDSLINIRALISTKLGIADSNLYVTPSLLLDSLAAHMVLINGKVPYSTLNDTAAAIRAAIPDVSGFVSLPQMNDTLTKFIRKGDTAIYVGTKQNILDSSAALRTILATKVNRSDSTVVFATPTQLRTKHTQGGDSRGVPIVIGSNDLQQVHIRTNGVTRTVIDSVGTVGIYTNKDSVLNIRNSGALAKGEIGIATSGNPLGVNSNDVYIASVGATATLTGYLGLSPGTRTLRALNMSTFIFGAINGTETATLSSTQATGATTGWNIRLLNNAWNLAASKTLLAIGMGNTYSQSAAAGTLTSIISTPITINSTLNSNIAMVHLNPTLTTLSAGIYYGIYSTLNASNGYSLYSSGNLRLVNAGRNMFGTTVDNLVHTVQVTGGISTDSIVLASLPVGVSTDSTMGYRNGRLYKIAPTPGITTDTTVTGNYTLTNKVYNYYNNTNIATWTLPASASGTRGRLLILINLGSGIVTVNSNAGGNDIYNLPTQTLINTFTINPGVKYTLEHNGTYFVKQN